MRLVWILALLAACSDSPVSRELGARCDSSAECDDRCLTEAEGYPGGLCSVVCESTADCPGDASCTEREGGSCLYDCAADADCAFLGAGWRCQEVDRRGAPAGKVKVCRGS